MSSESLSSIEDQQTVGLISNMEARSDHQVLKRFRTLQLCTLGLGLVLLVMVTVWAAHYRGGFDWNNINTVFNIHPVLMILGMILAYSQAMLMFRWGRNLSKKRLKLCHAGLHFFAFILAVIGLKAAFDSHNYAVPPKPNLYTLHSWIGLTTVILFAYQFLAGFITFLFPGLSKNVRAIYLPVHTNFGSAIFAMAVVTATLGFSEKVIWTLGTDYMNLPSEGVLVNFMGVLVVVFGVLILYLVNDPKYKRPVQPEDEIILTGHTE